MSSSSFVGACETSSVFTLESSERWIGPVSLRSCLRTAVSSVGSLNVTVVSFGQSASVFLGLAGEGAALADAEGAAETAAAADVTAGAGAALADADADAAPFVGAGSSQPAHVITTRPRARRAGFERVRDRRGAR